MSTSVNFVYADTTTILSSNHLEDNTLEENIDKEVMLMQKLLEEANSDTSIGLSSKTYEIEYGENSKVSLTVSTEPVKASRGWEVDNIYTDKEVLSIGSYYKTFY